MNNEPVTKGSMVTVTDGSLTEADARAMLERIRWPEGVRCVFEDCDGTQVYRIDTKGNDGENGKRKVSPRHLFKCKTCRRQFTVTKGTIFEDSHIPLRTWISVMYRMCSSKRGVSAYQIKREYGLSYEAAWFMCHRIRWAMTEKSVTAPLTGTVEADETYVGGKLRGHIEVRRATMTQSERVAAGMKKKTPVFGILERGGRVRAQVMPISKAGIQSVLAQNIDTRRARLMTDESALYGGINRHLPHGVIRHASEYVRGETHTNGIESFWSILKRGIIGTYYHVDAGYLNQYVQEFAFRHNTRKGSDFERFATLMKQVDGRLNWYLPDGQA